MTDADFQYSQSDFNKINELNEKVLEANLFTPDHVYIDINLLKDIKLGVIFTDIIAVKRDENLFRQFQKHLLTVVESYQTRTFDTVTPYFGSFGYTDEKIEELLKKREYHDQYFTMAPSTEFLKYLIKMTYLNKNHSGPGNKFNKKPVGDKQYVLEAMPITYYFNIYPLRISNSVLKVVGKEIGESFGVNVRWIDKDSSLFDKKDWNDWLNKIECYYIDIIGKFTKSSIMLEVMAEMMLVGRYVFCRKRFEKESERILKDENLDFESQIQIVTTYLDIFSEFNWIPNGDLSLTSQEDTPVKENDHE